MNVDYSDDLFAELESLGRDALKHCGFALVGGGIGERLNSKFIKLWHSNKKPSTLEL